MCGICGIYSFNYEEKIAEPLIRKMNDALRNRGPDDSGMYVKANVGLGNRRLSIIDVKGGHQPICNEDGTVWIVYNGEVYNFQDIRQDLEQKGHRFQTKTDTEVIVHLYEEVGTQCVSFLRGMFAFALWDEKRKRLLVARDRLGQKPLVYMQHNGKLYFASEIKSLFEIPDIHPNLKVSSLHHYLAYRTVPGSDTMFEQIKRLPQASMLVIENNQLKIERFWHLDFNRKISRTLNESCEEFLTILDESVKMRLISEVPLGAFLSGGVDSSLVVAMMSKYMTTPVKTYSIGFENQEDYNEFYYANKAAELFGAHHQNIIITPENIKTILPEMIRYYDEPEVVFSHVMSFYLSKIMRQEIVVALSGIGPDELFAGYAGYHVFRLIRLLDYCPAILRKICLQQVYTMLAYTKIKATTRDFRKLIASAMASPDRRKGAIYSVYSDDLKEWIYTEHFRQLTNNIDVTDVLVECYNDSNADNFLDAMLYIDLMVTHVHSLVRDADLSGMAHGLEIRSPFLDHKMVEFAASLPFSRKVSGLKLKYLVKKAAERILPTEIVYRKKMGFGEFPTRWLQNEWKDFAHETLLAGPLKDTGYFQMNAIRDILDEHTHMRRDHSLLLWTLIMLAIWYDQVYNKVKQH